jgi:hypothetical protein
MSLKKVTLTVLLSIGVLGIVPLPVEAQDGILFKLRAGSSNYCHLKFPAIREETLSSNRPVLKDASKDASTGDIIDFYGPCDYDPAGRAAVQAQRNEQQHRWIRAHAD